MIQHLLRITYLSIVLCFAFGLSVFAAEAEPESTADTVIVMPDLGDEIDFQEADNVKSDDSQILNIKGDFTDYPGMPVIIEFHSDNHGDISTVLKKTESFAKEISLPRDNYEITVVMAQNDVAGHYPLSAEPSSFFLADEPATVTVTYSNLKDNEIEEMDKEYISRMEEENLPKGTLTVMANSNGIAEDVLVVPLTSQRGNEYSIKLLKDLSYSERVKLPIGTYTIGDISADGSDLKYEYHTASDTVRISSQKPAQLEIFRGDPINKHNEIKDIPTEKPMEPESEEKSPDITLIAALAAALILIILTIIEKIHGKNRR